MLILSFLYFRLHHVFIYIIYRVIKSLLRQLNFSWKLEKPVQHDDSGDFSDLRTCYFIDFLLFLFFLCSIFGKRSFLFLLSYNNLLLLCFYQVTAYIWRVNTCSPWFLFTICLGWMIRFVQFRILKLIQWFLNLIINCFRVVVNADFFISLRLNGLFFRMKRDLVRGCFLGVASFAFLFQSLEIF